MSTTVSNLAAGQNTVAGARPRFFGIVRGEIFKVTRMWSVWISFVLLLGVICLPYLITVTVKAQGTILQKAPLHFFYNSISQNFFVLRAFSGFAGAWHRAAATPVRQVTGRFPYRAFRLARLPRPHRAAARDADAHPGGQLRRTQGAERGLLAQRRRLCAYLID